MHVYTCTCITIVVISKHIGVPTPIPIPSEFRGGGVNRSLFGHKLPWVKRFLGCSNEVPCSLQMGTNSEKYIDDISKSSSSEPWNQFQPTSLMRRKTRATLFSNGGGGLIFSKKAKIHTLPIFRNIYVILQNHLTNFNQT